MISVRITDTLFRWLSKSSKSQNFKKSSTVHSCITINKEDTMTSKLEEEKLYTLL